MGGAPGEDVGVTCADGEGADTRPLSTAYGLVRSSARSWKVPGSPLRAVAHRGTPVHHCPRRGAPACRGGAPLRCLHRRLGLRPSSRHRGQHPQRQCRDQAGVHDHRMGGTHPRWPRTPGLGADRGTGTHMVLRTRTGRWARSRHIATLILADILLVLAAGTTLAILVSLAVQPAASSYARDAFQVDVTLLRLATAPKLIAGALLVLVIAGVYPAIVAVRQDPLDVLEPKVP